MLRVKCVNGDIRTAGGWFQAIGGKGLWEILRIRKGNKVISLFTKQE